MQGDYGELIGELRDHFEFIQIVSHKLLDFGRQIIGTLLDRAPLRSGGTVDVSEETVDRIHLVFRKLAEEGAYMSFASWSSTLSRHDFLSFL